MAGRASRSFEELRHWLIVGWLGPVGSLVAGVGPG